MSRKEARRREQVRQCVSEIDRLLPELARRHPPLVVLAALTEHMGGSLCQSQESRDCTPKEARAIIELMTQLAFPASPS